VPSVRGTNAEISSEITMGCRKKKMISKSHWEMEDVGNIAWCEHDLQKR